MYFCSHYFCCVTYEGVSKSFRTGSLERELQMVQLSATRCSFIAILWVSLVSFVAITLCVASQRMFIVVNVYFVSTQSGNFWIHHLPEFTVMAVKELFLKDAVIYLLQLHVPLWLSQSARLLCEPFKHFPSSAQRAYAGSHMSTLSATLLETSFSIIPVYLFSRKVSVLCLIERF
jgi:hypothetical protein